MIADVEEKGGSLGFDFAGQVLDDPLVLEHLLKWQPFLGSVFQETRDQISRRRRNMRRKTQVDPTDTHRKAQRSSLAAVQQSIATVRASS